MAAPIKMPFGMLSWVDLGNLVLDGGSDPPVGRSNFVGEGHAPTSPMTFCHELRKKMAETTIEIRFGMWTWMGPRKHVLDGALIQTTPCHELCKNGSTDQDAV